MSFSVFRKLTPVFTGVLLVLFLTGGGVTFYTTAAYAQIKRPPCVACVVKGTCKAKDCDKAKDEVEEDHKNGKKKIIDFIGKSHDRDGTGGKEQFRKYEDWLLDFAIQHIIRAMMMMTEQLSAVAMQQVFEIGTVMDSKYQLTTQRLFQKLQADAHKDYTPSNDFCWFGTNVRSMAHSERVSQVNTQALNAMQMARHLGSARYAGVGMAGSAGEANDRQARWEQFTKTYCDPRDNNFRGSDTGLVLACGSGGGDRVNNDIDYTRLIDQPRSLDIKFDDAALSNREEDIIALSQNLYGHNVLTRSIDEQFLRNKPSQSLYLALRSVAAKRSVAESSFNTLVGMKAYGTTDNGETNKYLGAIMKELGVPENEIYAIIGENPSYYAQLELLAKKIYQNPNFYADLYDKPANVTRKSTALKAIELMLDKAIYESQLRREMIVSVLLSSKLTEDFSDVENRMGTNY